MRAWTAVRSSRLLIARRNPEPGCQLPTKKCARLKEDRRPGIHRNPEIHWNQKRGLARRIGVRGHSAVAEDCPAETNLAGGTGWTRSHSLGWTSDEGIAMLLQTVRKRQLLVSNGLRRRASGSWPSPTLSAVSCVRLIPGRPRKIARCNQPRTQHADPREVLPNCDGIAYNSLASESGGIGRRAGLRIQCRKACGFKSLLSHYPLGASDAAALGGACGLRRPR